MKDEKLYQLATEAMSDFQDDIEVGVILTESSMANEGLMDAIKGGWQGLKQGVKDGWNKGSSGKPQPKKKAASKPKKRTSSTAKKKTTVAKKTKKPTSSTKKKTVKKTATQHPITKKESKWVQWAKGKVEKVMSSIDGLKSFVTKYGQKIDKKLSKSSKNKKLASAWTTIKNCVSNPKKDGVQFLKKHWKAITTVVCLLAIAVFAGDAIADTCSGADSSSAALDEIGGGGEPIGSGDADIDADIGNGSFSNMDAYNSLNDSTREMIDDHGNGDWFKSLDDSDKGKLKEMFDDSPDEIAANDQAGFSWGGDNGLMSRKSNGNYFIYGNGGIGQSFNADGDPIDPDTGNVLDMKNEMQKMADSDIQHGVLKAKIWANMCYAMKHAVKIGAAQALPQ